MVENQNYDAVWIGRQTTFTVVPRLAAAGKRVAIVEGGRFRSCTLTINGMVMRMWGHHYVLIVEGTPETHANDKQNCLDPDMQHKCNVVSDL